MSDEPRPRRRPRLPKPPIAPKVPETVTGETLAVLQNRRFSALWLAQSATQVGANMVLFGLTVHIAERTGSTSAVSLMILTFLVPAVVFSAIAGVYVDRYDRRLILIVTNLLRAVAFLLMVVVDDRLALLYLLNILVSTVTTFFAPAEAAMIPVLVERRQLLAANGIFTFTLQASFMVGFALLGPLVVNLTGVQVLLLSVSLLYFVAAGLCFTLPSYAPPQAGLSATEAFGQVEAAVAGTVAQLREGVVYIRANHTIFWSLTYLAITASLIGVLGVLGPAFAQEALGLGPKDFVVVVLPLGLGIVMGILLLNSYGRLLPRRRVIEGGLLVVAITLALLSIAGPISRFLSARADTGIIDIGPVVSLLAIVVLLAFVAGISYVFVAVPSQTQLQEELPEEVRGRVFGVLNMLVSIASFLPIILVGPIADFIGAPVVILGCSVVVGIAGVASILRARPALAATATPGTHGAPVDPVAVTTLPLPRASDEAGAPLYAFSFGPPAAASTAPSSVAAGPPRNLGFRQAADWLRSRTARLPTAQRRTRADDAVAAGAKPAADDGFFVAPETEQDEGLVARSNEGGEAEGGESEGAEKEGPDNDDAARTELGTVASPSATVPPTGDEAENAAETERQDQWQAVEPTAPETAPDELPADVPVVPSSGPTLPPWSAQPTPPSADSTPPAAVPLEPPQPPARPKEEESQRGRRRPFAAWEARSSSPLADRDGTAEDESRAGRGDAEDEDSRGRTG